MVMLCLLQHKIKNILNINKLVNKIKLSSNFIGYIKPIYINTYIVPNFSKIRSIRFIFDGCDVVILFVE